MLVQTRELTEPLDLFMCIQCGKCTGGCPISGTSGLNLRAIIYNLLVESQYELGETEMYWDCTTCYTCNTRCPKDVRPADMLTAIRGKLVEAGKIPRNIGMALTGVFRQGNPFGMGAEDRMTWAKGLGLKDVFQEEAEALYYPGCISCYEARLQKVALSIVKCLQAAGVEVGTLGAQDTCCGSEVRRLGEMGLFEMMVEEGSQVLASAKAGRMITTSPHCFDVFANHYTDPGYPIQHYTQFMAALIEEGRLKLKGNVEAVVTYHDPCYLGKQNGIFDEPRAILKSIPGLVLVEMDRSRETSACCEGGGGRMWFDGTNPGVRLSHSRIREAIDTGAEILATACPFCVSTLEDAAKSLGLTEQIEVKDISELVAQAL